MSLGLSEVLSEEGRSDIMALVHCASLPNQQFPEIEEMVRLCYDKTRKVAWLDLRNTPFLLSWPKEGVLQVLIGAVNKPGKGWQPIQPDDATGGQHVSLSGNFADPDQILSFQQAILKSWASPQAVFDFSRGRVSDLAKGTTFGKSLTSASFVAKALKTGFDAIGKPMSAGPKFITWSIDDLLAYANRRAPALKDPALIGFRACAPNPAYDGKGDGMSRGDTRQLQYVHSVLAPSFEHFKGGFSEIEKKVFYERELEALNGIIPFERVIGYGFRGETRPPGVVKGAGGFLPNYTRPEHVRKHDEKLKKAKAAKDLNALLECAEAEGGALDLERFIADQTFRGFISTTKSIAIAKNFATSKWAYGMNVPGAVEGWVYACLVVGAFHLPPKGAHSWIKFNEQELAMPGMLDWENVVACRQVKRDGEFEGPVYMKPALERTDPKAARKIWKLLSGKSQGPM
jgi:hypothetical protein